MTPPLWHFSENSSDLVAWPVPHGNPQYNKGNDINKDGDGDKDSP